jgi:hypothetical protein
VAVALTKLADDREAMLASLDRLEALECGGPARLAALPTRCQSPTAQESCRKMGETIRRGGD